MAVLKMIALTMVGPHKEMEPVARQMVLSGGFQPLPIDFLVDDRSLRSRITTESDNPYDDLLNRMMTLWRISGESLPEPAPIPLEMGFNYYAARNTVAQTTGKLEIWDKRREALSDELEMLEAAHVYVEALQNIKLKPSELADARFSVTYFGRLSSDNFVRLAESTQDAPLLAVELSRANENVWALVFTVPSYLDGAKKILDAVYFKEFSLEDIAKRFSKEEPLKLIEHSIDLHKRSIAGLSEAALNILKNNREEFEKLYSKLYTMQRVYDLCKGRGEVSGMYILSGWIPEDTYDSVRKSIDEEAPMTTVIIEQVGDIPFTGVRIPTLLSNTRIVREFQSIVAMYSVPSYGEVDPAPFVAFTFILFFGFMFGDIGHAVILFLAASHLGKKKILNKSLAYVMKCASCSAFVFGLLYGSVLGVEDVIPALWLSPMHNTALLFSIAIIAGVIMISAGMVLNIITRYRDKDFGRLLFDGQGLAGLLVYWGSAGAICISIFKLPLPFPVSYIWYAIGLLVILTLFRDTLARTLLHQQAKEEESATLKVFEVMHNLMNYFTNTASFVRLAAFALNHVALSSAVLIIANMMERFQGGIVLKAIVFAIGNIFIVGLEGLIVFIQVLRLEYYEFFSKFYKGGGNVFKPVTWKRDRSYHKTA